jgi:hypothetical protein
MENELLRQLAKFQDMYREVLAENEELKQTLSDAMELNKRQREHANKMYELIGKFKMLLPTNP